MTRSDQQLKALPCPDPECGGTVSLLAGGSMGALCDTCGTRWSTRSYAQSLAQVRAELEEEREKGRLNVDAAIRAICCERRDYEARIASLEGELAEARERAGLFEGLPIRGLSVIDVERGVDCVVGPWLEYPEGCFSGKLVEVWKAVDDFDNDVVLAGPCETLGECLTALRTALASHSVEEDPDE